MTKRQAWQLNPKMEEVPEKVFVCFS